MTRQSERSAAKRVKMLKFKDEQTWAVVVDNKLVHDGLTLSETAFRCALEIKKLLKEDAQ